MRTLASLAIIPLSLIVLLIGALLAPGLTSTIIALMFSVQHGMIAVMLIIVVILLALGAH